MNLNKYFQHRVVWILGCLLWAFPLAVWAQTEQPQEQQRTVVQQSPTPETTLIFHNSTRQGRNTRSNTRTSYSVGNVDIIGSDNANQGGENDDDAFDPQSAAGSTGILTTALGVDGEDPLASTGDETCPKLFAHVDLMPLQPCAVSKATISYCNQGTTDAFDAYIDVTLDPAMALDSTELPYTHLGGQTYRFQLGTIATNDCAHFYIWVQTSCDSSLLGDQLCIQSHIYPDTLCAGLLPSAPLLLVDGSCVGQSTKFVIDNRGAQTTAADPIQYVVIEDHLLTGGQSTVIRQGTVVLPQNGILTEQIPHFSRGQSNYRMEIRDAANKLLVSSVVRNCTNGGTPQTINYYTNTFWNGSPLPALATGCAINGQRGTYASASLGSGTSTQGATGNSTSGGPSSIGASSEFTRVHIAPNPMGQQAVVTIEEAVADSYLFELYDATGQRVLTRTMTQRNQFVMERQSWAAGMYYYRLLTEGKPVHQGKLLLR